jgi:hypothetical protein
VSSLSSSDSSHSQSSEDWSVVGDSAKEQQQHVESGAVAAKERIGHGAEVVRDFVAIVAEKIRDMVRPDGAQKELEEEEDRSVEEQRLQRAREEVNEVVERETHGVASVPTVTASKGGK